MEDYQAASLEDSIEILRLFLWECRQNQKTESEESYQANTRKIELPSRNCQGQVVSSRFDLRGLFRKNGGSVSFLNDL